MSENTNKKKMKIIVTGGSGFIGSHTVNELVKRGHEVISVDRSMNWRNKDARYLELDVTNKVRTENLINEIKPDLILHLAGILGTSETWSHVQETVDSNINGALNVLQAAANIGADYLSVDVGSRWLVPYCLTKRCAAEFAYAYGNKYGFKASTLRIFNVFGPQQSTKIIKIVPKFIERALADLDLSVFGDKMADLIFVTDVARAFAMAAENMQAIDQVDGVLIGSGEPISVYDTAKMITSKIGKGRIVKTETRQGEEKVDAGFMQDDSAKKLLGWEPLVSLNDGMDETISWYKKYFGY